MVFLSLFMMALLPYPGQSAEYNCSAMYNRIPDDSDLTVQCGINTITLEVNYCTAQWAGFDQYNLALNGQHNNSLCKGVNVTDVDPPVIRFKLPMNDSQDNPCRQSLQIVDEVPTSAAFSGFSKIQVVIISSFINTPQATEGLISYSTDLSYYFSCRYPLEYLLNNTQIASSSVQIATTDNNGTFINTLSMSVYNDTDYMYPLLVPPSGLDLRTKVYVEVKATNLTGNFHVLLDHCFATPTAYNESATEKHDFFTGCEVDLRTLVEENGIGMSSRFSFEAFRFVQHRELQKSSIYLHCIIRLCSPSDCQKALNDCKARRRRSIEPFGQETEDSAKVTTGPLYVKDLDAVEKPMYSTYADPDRPARSNTNVTGLVVGLIFACAGAALLVMGAWFALKKYYL